MAGEVEQLVVEARNLGMSLKELTAAVAEQWQRLNAPPAAPQGERQKK
jgi:hypothetical protein